MISGDRYHLVATFQINTLLHHVLTLKHQITYIFGHEAHIVFVVLRIATSQAEITNLWFPRFNTCTNCLHPVFPYL